MTLFCRDYFFIYFVVRIKEKPYPKRHRAHLALKTTYRAHLAPPPRSAHIASPEAEYVRKTVMVTNIESHLSSVGLPCHLLPTDD